MNDKISVIIPVYNVENYLRECLDSVINQSYRNLEIICINDGSTDNSLKILEEYAKKDNRFVIINQKNQGQGRSRNSGIKAAKGDYIFFLDSDDYILQGTLEKLHTKILETKSDIVSSQTEAFADNDSPQVSERIIEIRSWLNNFVADNYQMTCQNFIDNIEYLNCTVWGKLYTSSFLKNNKILFIDSNIKNEDEGFWYKVCSCYPDITYIKDVGVMYRIRQGSTMSLNTERKMIFNLKENIKDAILYFEKYRKNDSASLKQQLKASSKYRYCHYEKKLGFIYRQRWYNNNKAIIVFGIPLFREKLDNDTKIIRILGIPVYKNTSIYYLSKRSGVFSPKISVIIPVYNVEKYLKTCLDSVCNQTLNDIEIICVNDGSTDNSLEILKDYERKDDRVVVMTQINRGQGAARNKGMRCAKGDYLFFLDSDDYILPNTLEQLYTAITETKSDITSVHLKAFPEDNSEIVLNRITELEQWLNKFTKLDCMITPENFVKSIESLNCVVCGKLYRKNFITEHKLSFIEHNIKNEDEGFWLKVCSCFPKIIYTGNVGVMYRIHQGSTMSVADDKRKKTNISLNIKDAFAYFDKYRNQCSKDLKDKVYSSKYREYIGGFEKQYGFLYRIRWYYNNKAIILFGIPFYREKLEANKMKIRIVGIPFYR